MYQFTTLDSWAKCSVCQLKEIKIRLIVDVISLLSVFAYKLAHIGPALPQFQEPKPSTCHTKYFHSI